MLIYLIWRIRDFRALPFCLKNKNDMVYDFMIYYQIKNQLEKFCSPYLDIEKRTK